MRLDQILQPLHVCARLRERSDRNRVPRHRDGEMVPGCVLQRENRPMSAIRWRRLIQTYHGRDDFLQTLGCAFCLWTATPETVLKLEQRLADGIREADIPRVDKRDLPDVPCL